MADKGPISANQELLEFSQVMGDVRDTLVLVSLELEDILFALPSPERDATLACVQTMLKRWRGAGNRP